MNVDHRMSFRCLLLAFLVSWICAPSSCAEEAFPKVRAVDVGLSTRAVELLDRHVEQLVENKEVVGVEVHVIKDRKTVLHQSYGWADRETNKKLTNDSIYCVRSMTKPLAGTAIQMLLDEGKVKLDQRVAEILPSFDHGQHADITIDHLLQHRSGLPFTIFEGPLSDYNSIVEVAKKAAKTKLDFEPGSSFQYSDAGTDTLGAVIQTISGKPLAEFIAARVLEPTQMKEAHALLTQIPDRSRVPSAYSGGTGNWEKHWDSASEPILPLFLASQGLFCTTTDYAKFLCQWMDGGKRKSQSLVSKQAIDRAFAPGSMMRGYPVGFSGLTLTYGQQWMLYHGKDSPRPNVFGHNGSDGTFAWAWPEEDLIVLLFTQSRGSTAGMEFEATLQQLLIDQDVETYRQTIAAQERAEKELAEYVGIYWDEDVDTAYYVVSLEDNQLYFERPGKFRAPGRAQPKEGLFQIGSSLKFQFELERTPPTAVFMTTTTRTERQPRFQPDPNLPGIDVVSNQVRHSYGLDRLAEAGVIKLSGKMRSGPLGLSSSITQWLDLHRSEFRVKSWTSEARVVANETDAAATNASGTLAHLSGAARLQELAAHPSVQYGNWTEFYDEVFVMRKVQRDNQSLFVIRAEVAGLPGKTFLVDSDSGKIVAEQSLQFVPGVGFLGASTKYSDFRETAGITLPFHVETKLSHALLGSTVIQIESIEVGADAEGRFELPQN